MEVSILVDRPDEIDGLEDLDADGRRWAEGRNGIRWVHLENANTGRAETDIGLIVSVRGAKSLKEPLNAMYHLARRYRCEFAVGEWTPDGAEAVCYFGLEEGRPDMFEVATYLGI